MKNDPNQPAAPAVSILDRPLRILHLEDSQDDRIIVQAWLRNQNMALEFTDVDTKDKYVSALEEGPFDIILSDKALPAYDGIEALRFAQEHCPHVPFVFVTGSMGEESAIDTIKRGATDYVLKERLSRLLPAVQRAIRESEQAEKSRLAEKQIRRQAALLDKAQDAIMELDLAGRVIFWNQSAERIYGWTANTIIGRKAGDLLPKDPARHDEAKKATLKSGAWTGELDAANRGGVEIIVESRWTLMRDEAGQPKGILIIDTDITEKKAWEVKFLRSQRMDSIGALAGGIAHDLNNALAPVLMSVDGLRDCGTEDEREKLLNIISGSAQRAINLVQQILTFARGSRNERTPVNLRHLIDEIARMIRDTFPKSIILDLKLQPELWPVKCDPVEIHQVLLNLCVNARDAMPAGGKLTVTSANFVLTEAEGPSVNAAPGDYVMISVADTGGGIPPEVLPRIFEPFFTTKTAGQGTGLGLSTVTELVKHHEGFMDLHTTACTGTDFKVYFPRMKTDDAAGAVLATMPMPVGQGETILVIDDEETVLELAKATLESYGYHVVTALNGAHGLARLKENPHEFKLLIADGDMPEMDGVKAIESIKELLPDLPIILSSGAENHGEAFKMFDTLRLQYLAKPYSIEQLLIAVDQRLHV